MIRVALRGMAARRIEQSWLVVGPIELGAEDGQRATRRLVGPLAPPAIVDHSGSRADVGDDVGDLPGRVRGVRRDHHQPGSQGG